MIPHAEVVDLVLKRALVVYQKQDQNKLQTMQDPSKKSVFPANDPPPFGGSGTPTPQATPLATTPVAQNTTPAIPNPVSLVPQQEIPPKEEASVSQTHSQPEPQIRVSEATIPATENISLTNEPTAEPLMSQSFDAFPKTENPPIPVQENTSASTIPTPPLEPTKTTPIVSDPVSAPLTSARFVESLPKAQETPVPTVPTTQTPSLPHTDVSSVLTQSPPVPVAAPTIPVQASVSQAPHEVAPDLIKKKGGIPKMAIFALIGILLFGLLVFVIMQLMGGGNTSSVGTKGEITWWGLTLDEDVVSPLIEQYEKEHEGVNITYVKQSPQEYRERLTNALAKGSGPDIFEIHNSWTPMFRNDLSVLPSSVMSSDDYKKSFYPIFTSDFTTPKGIVAMPLEYDAITLYVNEEIFSSALKTAPKTWNEVRTLADPATGLSQKDDLGRIIQSGIALGTTENVEYWPEVFGLMMYQNAASFTDFTSAKTKDVVSFYTYFKQVGAWDTTLPSSTSAFAKQKTAMIFAPAKAAYGIIQESPSIRFKTYPLPQLEKETPTEPDVSYATYWAQSVWARSTNSDVAWDFLKYMSDPVSLQKVNLSLKAKNRIERAYPRPVMNQEYTNHPILGSVVALAASSKSWYLADKTNDGATGINTLLKAAYASAFVDTTEASAPIIQILTQYGIALPK